jgi:sterol desaturase/sphingolipid hydroxylase (fatty acid hydroxylase superfamily)
LQGETDLNDEEFGVRDSKNNWAPIDPICATPLFVWPWSLSRFVKWLPSYFLPWNALIFLISVITFFLFTPEKEQLKSVEAGWVSLIFIKNLILAALVYGSAEFVLYILRKQRNRFKYRSDFPNDKSSSIFLTGNQTIDGAIRTLGFGVPIWSLYETLILHYWATDKGPWVMFADHLWYLMGFIIILPLIHELHFYCIHRMIHHPFLYKHVHSIHHNSVNPSPWSSLSMHPIEHALYWSGSLVHLIIGSHPLVAVFHLQLAALGALVGHLGFHKLELGCGKSLDTHAYAHYLHHKLFEVNYADGTLPLDRWFGSWHDGSAEADEAMRERRKRRMRSEA